MTRSALLLPTVCLVLAVPSAFAAPSLPRERQEQALQLVRKLGDPSFKVREEAGEELVKFGRAVEPLLRAGLKDADPEIRDRCRRLLPQAVAYDLERHLKAFLTDAETTRKHDLAGWERFRTLIGSDREAKELFADMHRTNGELMELAERNPNEAAPRLVSRCEQFQRTVYQQPTGLSRAEMASLLFLTADPKLKGNGQSHMYLSGALYSYSYQPVGKSALRNTPAIRKLLVAYIDQSDDRTMYNDIQLLCNLELKEGLDLAVKQIRSPNKAAATFAKAMAVAVVGKLGDKSHIPLLQPLLDDTTQVGAAGFNNIQIRTQLRDVALASLAMLGGQQPVDYGFPYLQMFKGKNVQMNVTMSPTLLGFADDASRNAAIKKWKDWYEAQPKK